MSWANFSVNVLGLTNKQKICQNLKKKNLSFGFREKKAGKNGEEMWKIREVGKKPINVLGFFSKCPGLF